MFKELICAIALTGTIGASTPQNTNEGTYYQDVTITETYEYETNEVNSVDDLVVGNIYKFYINDNIPNGNSSTIYYSKTFGYNYIFNTNDGTTLTTLQNQDIDLYINFNNGYFRYMIFKTTDGYQAGIRNTVSNANAEICVYFIYKSSNNPSLILNYISASDYLGEKTTTITPKEFNGLYSIFENFLHERIFSGGKLDTISTTVLGTTMTLGAWLSCTTSIALLILIIVLLVLLIKFIFKFVGGMMIWKS